MKKRFLFICLLVTGIVAAAVSDTSAIYSHSIPLASGQITFLDDDVVIPEVPVEFLKYEMNTMYPDSKVMLNEATGKISVKGEAGAMRVFDNAANYIDYQVTSVFHSISPQPTELKNIGLTFNGSRADHQQTGVNGVGYVLKFNNEGVLEIVPQGFENNHINDNYNEIAKRETYEILKKAEVDAFIMQHNIDLSQDIRLDVKVHMEGIFNEKYMVFIFINGHVVNPEGKIISHDCRIDQVDGNGKNSMVGMSTYQTRDENQTFVTPTREILVSQLSVSDWDFQAEVDAQKTIFPKNLDQIK